MLPSAWLMMRTLLLGASRQTCAGVGAGGNCAGADAGGGHGDGDGDRGNNDNSYPALGARKNWNADDRVP
eukprot:9635968-Lingulodinium_polyedra.AAC.1